MEIDTGMRKIKSAEQYREKTSRFIENFNSWLRIYGLQRSVPVVDLYSSFGSKDRRDLLDDRFAIGDNAHLNLEGQKLIAKLLYEGYFKDAEEANVIVCLGDSHTQGYPVRMDLSRNGEPIDLEKDDAHQFPYWLKKTTGRTFINRGLAGNTLYGMRNRFDKEVLTHYPDHCVIIGGTNDALLGSFLEESMDDMKAIIEKCICAEITPVVGTIIPLGF